MARKTRAELDAELDALQLWVPQMLGETDDASQMDAFAGRAEMIQEATGPDDREHVWNRLQCILRDMGLIPGDDEPCDED